MFEFLKSIFAFNESSPLLFTQFYFWAFFALVFAVFSLVQSKRLLRNAFLFFVSLFFYYKTSGVFVLILLFVTTSDFLIAQRIDRTEREGRRKAWLCLSVLIDLGLLCYFKYAYFFTNMVNDLFGMHLTIVDRIVLPVGISFFTFQVISYTVDVYRRQVKPVTNWLDFGFYVSFFPQLVAGPIVRANSFIPQLYKPYHLSRRQFGIAVFWILNGLMKKIILSDYLAVNFIDRVFQNPLLFTGFENFAALFCYSMQVYADFSGYTDIAIGIAMLMGFYLPQNFNSPYKAPNAQNFWQRWHMSLSGWLKNYLYIPLGGNRTAGFATYTTITIIAVIALVLTGSWWATAIIMGIAGVVALVAWLKPERRKKITANLNRFITMLLGGLWHGASWNFMIWGGLNGVGMLIYLFWKEMKWGWRLALINGTLLLLMVLMHFSPAPVWNLFFVWMACIALGSAVRAAYSLKKQAKPMPWLANAWAVMQTFVFITFTRLFFRSGSNLDPATANHEAWQTAQQMVHQIGSAWAMDKIWPVMVAYRNVFLLFLAGMLIHWLPTRWKRWYRLNIALLPVPVLMLVVVAVVFVVYQFITADLQAFIYFQF